MTKNCLILGAHAFLFREGDAYTLPNPGGNAGREAKPGPTDPAWLDLGELDAEITTSWKEYELMGASPARKELVDVIIHSPDLQVKLKLKELSDVVMEALFGAADLAGGGQFTPMSLATSKKAWINLQYFSNADDDDPLVTLDLFCQIKFDGSFAPGDDPVLPALIGRKLRSTLNTGELAA